KPTTNASGSFSARSLKVGGPYLISISGSDFQDVKIDDVYLSLDEVFSLPVTVKSATAMEEVTVTAQSLGDTGFSSGALTTTLGLKALSEVVSIDRDITDAAELDPFASVNVQSGGAKELSIAGANNRFNSLTIDGVALNDRFGLNANGYPSQRSPISYDAIESLSIQTAPFDVEYNGFTGGTINAVTKSGTNEFKGSVSYYSTDDSMIGDKSRDDEFDFQFEEETFAATFGGPIIKDKLFFFVAYDKYEEIAPLSRGPAGSGALNTEPDITTDDVAQVAQIVSDVWGFDIGGFSKSPAQDEKILANVDWNISENHRAKFTYISTEGNTIIEQNGNNFEIPFNPNGGNNVLGASSAWYDRSEEVESMIGHVFSDWSDSFSTELKIASTTQATGQDSLNGSEFPSMAVFLREANGDNNYLVIGPDRYRHGNELDQEFFQIKFVAEYVLGDHIIKFGIEREEVDVDNLFAQNSEGSYLFDSLTDLQNATASSLSYDNAITNDENDLRAIWGYDYQSIYLQDSWDVNGSLIIDFGLRYDEYSSNGTIRENQNFIDRYGFSNTNDIDGLDVLLPRLSFKWFVSDNTTVRGGIGRFSGGSPGVWISNSYSNDGVISDSTSADGPINVPTTPDSATGQYIPADVLAALANEAPDGSVNALDPNFEIPTTTKMSLGVAHETDLGFLGENWLLSADVLYNTLDNASYWYDARCTQVPGQAPDGRPVYDCSGGGAKQSIVVSSFDGGESTLFALAASKEWNTKAGDFDLFMSYTNSDVKDIGYGTSSTATSNYSDFAAYDRQSPREGTSNFQVEHMFKLRLNWSKELIAGYETKVSVFATRRSGQPYSYTFEENNNCVLDLGGGKCARESSNDDAGHLLYVPSGINDPLFSPNSFNGDAAAQQAFFDYISSSELAQYAGSIAPRNGDNSRWSTIFDVRIQQELPAFSDDHSFKVFLDIENFGNLLNDDWGRVERTSYEYERRVASAIIENGQYKYKSLNSDRSIKNLEILSQSVWQIQLGLKYDF
ncbi:TonB-dependent receptor, partial [Aequoribacter fuscus]|uniref:TonB-dependent receptor n=1 Tax=Aequoribacter fuscus TaxID=2518989 RepID=UPI0005939A44